MTSERTLLVDGDVIAFRCASAVQKTEEDGFGYVRPFANIVEGQAALDNMLLGLMDGLKATHVRIVLTDPETNWRHNVMPTYKDIRDRSAVVRPLLLGRLKEYLRVRYGAFHWAAMEADDVLGILATEPQTYPGDRIVVGKDKDFKTIPGLHHVLGDRTASGKPVISEVTREEADRFHLTQALAGDKVDGYDGCPGLGMERAARLVAEPVVLRPEKGVITRGPRKGESVTKWVSEPTADLWLMIVTHYQKAGLTEADALANARVARILRHEDYNRDTEELRLWTPSLLRR